MNKLFVLLAMSLLLSLGSNAFADEISAGKRADILKLLEVSGAMENAKKSGEFMSQQVIEQARKQNPDMDPRAFTILSEETGKIFAENLDKFRELLIPIYDKYFSGDEIKEFLAYCSSPIGQKVISVMPALTQECMQAGRQFGEELSPVLIDRVVARMNEEGVGEGSNENAPAPDEGTVDDGSESGSASDPGIYDDDEGDAENPGIIDDGGSEGDAEPGPGIDDDGGSEGDTEPDSGTDDNGSEEDNPEQNPVI